MPRFALPTTKLAILALLAAVIGCRDEQPVAPQASTANVSATGARITPPGHLKNHDEKFLELAQRAPGFGGVSFDTAGNAVVYVTDLGKSGQVGPVVAEYMRNRAKDGEAPGGNGPPLRFVEGDFDWPTLKSWKDSLRGPVFRDPAVSFIDADEGHNRVTIGVASTADEDRVRQLARSLGAPPGLIRFVHEAKATYRVNLRQAYSPRIGGLQIENGNFLCTLGIIASYNYIGNRALVTNSHCTATKFQNTSTVIKQGGATVGTEVNDVPLFQGVGGCPPGRYCRNSDAAVIDLNDGISSEYGIAFTGLTNSPCVNKSCGSQIDIKGRLQVTGDNYVTQNMTVNKTGRTTGWTRGTVTNTCADTPSDPMYWPPAGTTIEPLLLCQIHTSIWSEGGDSGSPVYTRYTYTAGTPGYATLHGIMWGGPPTNYNITWVSPIYGVNNDVGALTWY